MTTRAHSDHLGPCLACGEEIARRRSAVAEAEHLIVVILGRLDRADRLEILDRLAAAIR